MGLSGLGIVLQCERLLVLFPVRARAWVVELVRSVPSQGTYKRQPIMFLSPIDVPVPLFLSLSTPLSKNKKIKSLKKKEVAEPSYNPTPGHLRLR